MFDIREAIPEQASEISALHGICFDDAWSAEQFSLWLKSAAYIGQTAWSDGQLASFALARQAADEVELITVATAPDCRGQGLARLCITAIDQIISARGARKWLLEVAVDNVAALQLYENLGFETIALRKNYYRRKDVRVDALVLGQKAGCF